MKPSGKLVVGKNHDRAFKYDLSAKPCFIHSFSFLLTSEIVKDAASNSMATYVLLFVTFPLHRQACLIKLCYVMKPFYNQ